MRKLNKEARLVVTGSYYFKWGRGEDELLTINGIKWGYS